MKIIVFLIFNSPLANHNVQLLLCTIYPTFPSFNNPKKTAFVEKVENAGNDHFLCFQQCFIPFPKQIQLFEPHIKFLY